MLLLIIFIFILGISLIFSPFYISYIAAPLMVGSAMNDRLVSGGYIDCSPYQDDNNFRIKFKGKSLYIDAANFYFAFSNDMVMVNTDKINALSILIKNIKYKLRNVEINIVLKNNNSVSPHQNNTQLIVERKAVQLRLLILDFSIRYPTVNFYIAEDINPRIYSHSTAGRDDVALLLLTILGNTNILSEAEQEQPVANTQHNPTISDTTFETIIRDTNDFRNSYSPFNYTQHNVLLLPVRFYGVNTNIIYHMINNYAIYQTTQNYVFTQISIDSHGNYITQLPLGRDTTNRSIIGRMIQIIKIATELQKYRYWNKPAFNFISQNRHGSTLGYYDIITIINNFRSNPNISSGNDYMFTVIDAAMIYYSNLNFTPYPIQPTTPNISFGKQIINNIINYYCQQYNNNARNITHKNDNSLTNHPQKKKRRTYFSGYQSSSDESSDDESTDDDAYHHRRSRQPPERSHSQPPEQQSSDSSHSQPPEQQSSDSSHSQSSDSSHSQSSDSSHSQSSEQQLPDCPPASSYLLSMDNFRSGELKIMQNNTPEFLLYKIRSGVYKYQVSVIPKQIDLEKIYKFLKNYRIGYKIVESENITDKILFNSEGYIDNKSHIFYPSKYPKQCITLEV